MKKILNKYFVSYFYLFIIEIFKYLFHLLTKYE